MTGDGDAAPTGTDAVDEAVARMRAVAAETDATGPGDAGTADADVLRTALATLGDAEQRLLWEHHVRGRSLDTVAYALGLHVRAAARRLRRAEEQLAAALSAAHARGAPQRLCAETRGALSDYVGHRLGGGRRLALEDHLFGCAGCLRAFVDVRESAWALRDAAPVLLGPLLASGVTVPVVVGAVGASTTSGAGWFAALGAALAAAWEGIVRGVRWLVARPAGLAAGAAAAVVGAAAMAMVLAPGTAPDDTPVPVAASPTAPAPSDEGSTAPTTPAEIGPSPSAPDPTPTPEASEGVELDAGDVGAREQTPADVDGDGTADDDAPADDSASDDATDGQATDQPEPGGSTAPEQPDGPATEAPRPAPTDGTEATPRPTQPVDPARPTPAPSEPADPPSPPGEVDPPSEPVTATITLRVGGVGWYQVVATNDGEIVDVVGGQRTEVSKDGRDRWWVRAVGTREREVTVQVTGAAGTEPGARLSWFGLEH